MKFSENQHINPKVLDEHVEMRSTRDGFGEILLQLGKQHEAIVALSADLTESSRVHLFAKEFPERFVQMGVAEQNMAGVATGLALDGKIPFLCSFAVFNPGRNWDQIRIACYDEANIKVVGGYAGFGNGGDGATHQGFEDLALTRVIPNMTVLSPCDFEQTRACVKAAFDHKGPVYIRTTKAEIPDITTVKTPFKIGEANVLKEGKNITLIGTGPIMHEVIKAADILEKDGVSCEVINIASIKPLNEKTIIESAKKTGKIITVEEHQKNAGFGSLICRILSENYPTPVKVIGIEDTFGESGQIHDLKEKYKLTAHHIVKAANGFHK